MFIGQNHALALLQSIDQHFLIVGPPGHGKSSLIRTFATNRHIIGVKAGIIKDHNALYACLRNLEEGSILFIDEIHRLSNILQESLYELVDDQVFVRVQGRGKNQSLEQINLPKFILCAATTREDHVLAPLLSRFLTIHLTPYEEPELVKIATSAGLTVDVATLLAQNCRRTPRTLINFCKAFRNACGQTRQDAERLLAHLDVHPMGLTRTEILLLKNLRNQTLSLSSLAAKLMLDEDVVANTHEPYLIQIGLLTRSRSGRELTRAGEIYVTKNQNAALPIDAKETYDGTGRTTQGYLS